MTRIYNRSSMKDRRQTLRRNMTKTEIILWSKIRRKQIDGYRFRRQYSIGAYILDFYCPELKLAIEIDGESHFHRNAEEYDKVREKDIKGLGIEVLRFQNREVYNNIDGVLLTIHERIESIESINITPYGPPW